MYTPARYRLITQATIYHIYHLSVCAATFGKSKNRQRLGCALVQLVCCIEWLLSTMFVHMRASTCRKNRLRYNTYDYHGTCLFRSRSKRTSTYSRSPKLPPGIATTVLFECTNERHVQLLYIPVPSHAPVIPLMSSDLINALNSIDICPTPYFTASSLIHGKSPLLRKNVHKRSRWSGHHASSTGVRSCGYSVA